MRKPKHMSVSHLDPLLFLLHVISPGNAMCQHGCNTIRWQGVRLSPVGTHKPCG